MDAVEPVCSQERVVDVRGRAPSPAPRPGLGTRRPARPSARWSRWICVLDAERPLLVITGPNAGGKTVALKTLGPPRLDGAGGLHLPAPRGRPAPAVLEPLFAIVGDEQSVAENLSTFSAFVRQLARGARPGGRRDSLVLLDELGAGTDPDDGAALAQAVLEELADRGALCVASTHLEPLKGFAATDPRARNASVEFDGERLEPTFRLVYDRPGQSYALAIGARLGLPARPHRAGARAPLHPARGAPGADRRASTRATARGRARRRHRAAARRRARGSFAARAAEAEAARESARETVARARADAQQLVADVRRAVNDEWETLQRGERTREEPRAEPAPAARDRTARGDAGTRARRPTRRDWRPLPGDRVRWRTWASRET